MHFRPKNRPGERPPHRKLHIARDVLALIGAGTLLYLFITEVVMRILACFTPAGGGSL